MARTREAAAFRLVESAWRRAFNAAYAKWQRQMVEFHVGRVLEAAELLGMPPEEIGRTEIVWCHVQHGRPPLDDQAPKLVDVPLDGRMRRARVLAGMSPTECGRR